jgi:two-component system sensor histidine kinase HydH
MRFRGRLALWGLAIGAVGGVLDTLLLLSLGIDLTIAGRDATFFVAAYLAASFALLCGAIGWFIDARSRARRDAATIREQLSQLEATRRVASQNEKRAAQNEKLAAIGRLAAGVAHEVRNPLGVIRASASMVQESFEREDEAFRACQFICEEADRLNGLITALLDFSRPTRPRFHTTSLEKVVDRALHLAGRDLEGRGVAVERTSTGTVPDLVADPDLLAQLVFDLVGNAAEALEGPGRIALRLEGGRDFVQIDVADSGPGVAPEDLERVFEPFYTTKTTGTGLGLAMSQRIVQSHGGDIAVVPGAGAGASGSGACFRVRLPLQPVAGVPA